MTPTPEYRTILLTHGQVTIVDAADYELLSRWRWYARWCKKTNGYYASRNSSRKGFQMSREILGLVAGDRLKADHINHDTLDNRRVNLRIATNSENMRNRGKSVVNTSGYKGVSWHKDTGRWGAYIGIGNRKMKYLGLFDTPEEAYAAYCEAAKHYHGEFARFA